MNGHKTEPRKARSRGIARLLLSVALAGPLLGAATTLPAEAQSQSITIAAQPLSSAMSAFGRATGWQLPACRPTEGAHRAGKWLRRDGDALALRLRGERCCRPEQRSRQCHAQEQPRDPPAPRLSRFRFMAVHLSLSCRAHMSPLRKQ